MFSCRRKKNHSATIKHSRHGCHVPWSSVHNFPNVSELFQAFLSKSSLLDSILLTAKTPAGSLRFSQAGARVGSRAQSQGSCFSVDPAGYLEEGFRAMQTLLRFFSCRHQRFRKKKNPASTAAVHCYSLQICQIGEHADLLNANTAGYAESQEDTRVRTASKVVQFSTNTA